MEASLARTGSPGIASPLPQALLAQLLGIAGATAFAAAISLATGTGLPSALWIAAQAVLAVAFARWLRMDWWWLPVHLAFAPALMVATKLEPQWGGVMLALLLLLYGGTQRTRVPLYLSSAAATRALSALLPRDAQSRLLDVGCGTGTVLAALAHSHPQMRLQGVERAPLPWLLARLRALRSGRYQVTWGDLWQVDLSGFDVVYAYLSPAPMAALWEKAQREMRPGSLLVSFRFAIPGVTPDVELAAGPDRVYAWRI